MQPIVLGPNQPAQFYRGGAAIAAFRGLPAGDSAFTPEDWVASTVTRFGRGDGLSTLPDGRLLATAIAADTQGFLGPRGAAAQLADPALLVKLLDAGERLPVHVHPDRDFAHRHLGNAHGKSEAWIVLGTSSADARVYLGFRDPVDDETFSRWVEQQDSDAMLEALNRLRVEPGDTVFVPAGTPHAIGAGIFIAELQEPTDFSVMLEWEKFGLTGLETEQLGLPTPVALSCLDRTGWPDDRVAAHVRKHAFRSDAGSTSLLPPDADRFFRAEHVVVDEATEFEAQYSVLIMLDGSAWLQTGNDAIEVRRGDTVLVPYGAGTLHVSGAASFLRCLPPAA